MQAIKSQLILAVLAAVSQATDNEYFWTGPSVTSSGKTLQATGSTDWATTGTGADRKLTRYLT